MSASSHREVDYEALAEFRHELRKFLNFSEQAARTAQLETQQHQALLAVKGLPVGERSNVGMLAEKMQIQHHSAVELADRLEKHGLLRRERNPEDHREVLLRLTARGEHVLEKLTREHRDELLSAGPKLIRSLQGALQHAQRNARQRPLKSTKRSKTRG